MCRVWIGDRDLVRQLAVSCELAQECFGVEKPGIREFFRWPGLVLHGELIVV